MSVMIQVDFLLYPVGHSDFLHAFFSTICGGAAAEEVSPIQCGMGYR